MAKEIAQVTEQPFRMTISLNVLRHLGINLYSNAPTVFTLSVKSRLGSRKLLIVNELRHGRSAVGVVIVSLLSFPLAETIPVEAIS